MNLVEKKAAEQEALGQAAFQELQKHLATHKEMLGRFEAADKKAVACARELIPLHEANSPTATPLRVQLYTLRAERDAISWDWNRKKEVLEATLENINLPEIFTFHRWIIATVQRLQNRTTTQFERGMLRYNGSRLVAVRTNAMAVGKAQKDLFEGLKQVQTLRLRPLLEIHGKINLVVAAYEDAILNGLPLAQLDVSEAKLGELQNISRALDEENKTVTYRDGIRHET